MTNDHSTASLIIQKKEKKKGLVYLTLAGPTPGNIHNQRKLSVESWEMGIINRLYNTVNMQADPIQFKLDIRVLEFKPAE